MDIFKLYFEVNITENIIKSHAIHAILFILMFLFTSQISLNYLNKSDKCFC